MTNAADDRFFVSDPRKPRRLALFPAGVVVVILGQDERILLLKAPGGDGYEPVNGALEAGESVEEAALRETREEAGPHLGVRLLGSFHAFTVEYHPELPHLISIWIVADSLGGAVEPGDDMVGSEVRWARAEEIAPDELASWVFRCRELLPRAVEAARLMR